MSKSTELEYNGSGLKIFLGDSQDSNHAMMILHIREKIPRKPQAKIKQLKE